MEDALSEQAAADALAALGNRTRLRLFKLLVRAGTDGLIVGEVQRHMDMPASTLAHHLAALTRAGLVVQARNGREVVCYWRDLAPREAREFVVDAVARVPGTTTGPASRVRLYYSPSEVRWVAPLSIDVRSER